jgi:hypothetical protein
MLLRRTQARPWLHALDSLTRIHSTYEDNFHTHYMSVDVCTYIRLGCTMGQLSLISQPYSNYLLWHSCTSCAMACFLQGPPWVTWGELYSGSLYPIESHRIMCLLFYGVGCNPHLIPSNDDTFGCKGQPPDMETVHRFNTQVYQCVWCNADAFQRGLTWIIELRRS